MQRPPRRWAALAATAAVLALMLAIPAILPSGTPGGPRRASAAISFATKGGYIEAVIKDPEADSEELNAAFADQGLDITLRLVPASPSFVGKFLGGSVDNGETGPPIEELQSDDACTTPGGLTCPIGLRIPLDYQGHADLELGRAAGPGETYGSANDAFAAGEALHCSGLRGMTVEQALPVVDRLGLTVVWRSFDPAVNVDEGIDPAVIAGQYVSDAVPHSAGHVYIWVVPDPPPQPEPGTPLADYFEKLSRGC